MAFTFCHERDCKGNKNSLHILDYLNNKSKDFPMMHIDYISLLIMMKIHGKDQLSKDLEKFKNLAALTVTLEGMPLIYNGQEANLSKDLNFLKKIV